jgi:hypothetical protein
MTVKEMGPLWQSPRGERRCATLAEIAHHTRDHALNELRRRAPVARAVQLIHSQLSEWDHWWGNSGADVGVPKTN